MKRFIPVAALAALFAVTAALSPVQAADYKASPQQKQAQQATYAPAPAPAATGFGFLLPATSLVGLAATTTSTHFLTSKFYITKWIPKKIWIHGHKKIIWKKVKIAKTKTTSRSSKGIDGKIAVGCIFGSALSLILNASHKAAAMGNPLRWRSQAEHERIVASGYEKQFELTNEEAQLASAFCGLGGFAVAAQYSHGYQQTSAAPVQARY